MSIKFGTSGWRGLIARDFTFDNVRVEVDVEPQPDDPNGAWGVICNYADSENFYYMSFGSDGYYAIARYLNDKYEVLSDSSGNYVESALIEKGKSSYHVEATCAAIRKVLRSNGFGSSTRVVEGVVHVWSDDAYEAIDPAEIRASVTSAIERMTTGVDTAPDRDRDPDSTPGPIDWHTWVIE